MDTIEIIEIIDFVIDTNYVEVTSDNRRFLICALVTEGAERGKSILNILRCIKIVFACPFLDETIVEYRQGSSLLNMAKDTYDTILR